MSFIGQYQILLKVLSRRKGNDQEPMQSNSISHPQTPNGKGTQTRSRWPKSYPKQYEQNVNEWIDYNPPPTNSVTSISKMNHSRSTALERSVINYLGWGLNRFYVYATLAITSAVVHEHTRGSGCGGVWNSPISKNLAHYSLSLKLLLIL